MRELTLSRGKVAQVSDSDYEKASKQKWSALLTKDEKWYAVCMMDGKYIYLHRYLMEAGPDEQVDHIDGSGLNCQRDNMRICNNRQNSMNQKAQARNNKISKYKGVGRYRNSSTWRAYIFFEKQINLGNYKTEDEAGIAYNHAARECFKEFAFYNDIPGWENIFPVAMRLRSTNTSGYIGVSWSKRHKKWEVHVRRGSVRVYCGLFDDPKEAALARDEQTRRLYGDKAKLNFD